MKFRRLLIKAGISAVAFVMVLSMGGPVTQAASAQIVVDDISPADNCGKYDDDTASTNVVDAINNAPDGATIIICPGTYPTATLGAITITGKKLTIKRAITGLDSRPMIDVDDLLTWGIKATDSTVTIDGVVIDGRGNNVSDYVGLMLIRSAATIKNSALLGPDANNSEGIFANATGLAKAVKVSISDSLVSGYKELGILAQGPMTMTITSTTLDSTDGGRIATKAGYGIAFFGNVAGEPVATGSVTSSRILNNLTGVMINEASKVKLKNNILSNNDTGAYIYVSGSHHVADSTSITGNTFLDIPLNGFGVKIGNVAADPSVFTIKKTTISGNLFIASQYAPGGGIRYGIIITSTNPALDTVTTTVSGNTFVGLPASNRVFNDLNTTVTLKTNESMP